MYTYCTLVRLELLPPLKKYFDASYEYIGSLKPKPTTKKKKAV